MFSLLCLKLARLFVRLGGFGKSLKAVKSIFILCPKLTSQEVWKVECVFEGGLIATHFMAFENIGRFIEASNQLHYCPGINPHNNQRTPKMKEILLWKLRTSGPLWWTTPGLGKNDDGGYISAYPGGAVLLEWSLFRRIPLDKLIKPKDWMSPSFSVQASCQ